MPDTPEAAAKELPEEACLFDLPEDRFDNLLGSAGSGSDDQRAVYRISPHCWIRRHFVPPRR